MKCLPWNIDQAEKNNYWNLLIDAKLIKYEYLYCFDNIIIIITIILFNVDFKEEVISTYKNQHKQNYSLKTWQEHNIFTDNFLKLFLKTENLKRNLW